MVEGLPVRLRRAPVAEHAVVTLLPCCGEPLDDRVQSLEDVQYYHAAASERGLHDLRSTDHGNAWSIYFLDPEGNRIEVYAPSPWYVSQPCQAPLDIALPAAETAPISMLCQGFHPRPSRS